MRRRPIGFIVLLTLTAFLSAQETITLNGTVTGPGQTAVEGAVLKLYQISMAGENQMSYQIRPVGETKSDAQGKFTFSEENRPTGGAAFYTCIGYKEGLSCGWKTLLQDGQNLDIRLTEPQKMIGFIQEPDGKGIEGVEVRLAFLGIQGDSSNFTLGLEPMDAFVSVTCDQGRFEFNTLPVGASAEIIAKKEGKGILHTFTADMNTEAGLTYKAGQTEIMLTMQKPCTVSGVALTKQGQMPVEGVRIMAAQENIPMNLLGINPVVSAADGSFQITQLPPGSYTLSLMDCPDWIAEPVTLDVQGSIGARIELQKGGQLEIRVIDGTTDQPLDGVTVSIRRQDGSSSSSSMTDSSGIAKKQLLPGNYELFGYKQGFKRSQNAAVAVIEDGKTTTVEIRLGGQQKLTGIVKGVDGKPARDVAVRIMPNNGMPQNIKTDDKGQFSIAWNPEEMSWTDGQFYLLAVDEDKKLAGAEMFDAQAKELTVSLQKGASVKGKVLNESGKPLKDAQADLMFWGGNWGTSYGSEAKTNADGEYVFTGVPLEQKFSVGIRAVKGYGTDNTQQFTTDTADEPMVLEDIVLKVADRQLSGQAVDAEGKPLANIRVNISGDGQPSDSAVTDKEGQFKFENVCAGTINLYANSNGGSYIYGRLRTEGGAEGVTIVLSQQGGYARYEPKKPASLVGKELPDLTGYGVDVPADANSVLVFVWDMQQRPSRHFVKELSAQKELLESKGVAVILVNTSNIEKETLDQWLAENGVKCPCGIMAIDPENAKFNLGVQGLPWLILADKEKKVTAEGFAVEELGDKIKSL